LSHLKSSGTIVFSGANIGNNLVCRGAKLEAPAEYTLLGVDATIGGSVDLSDHFNSNGEVRFEGAKISNDFVCEGGRFIQTNADYYAIDLVEADIRGSLILRTNFSAVGTLDFKGVNVAHLLFLNGIKAPNDMILDLRSANINSLFDDEKSWPKAGNLFLDNFMYSEFYSVAPTDAKSRIDWLHRQPTGHFFAQPYDQLAGVLRHMGHEEDAAEVMIAKNKDYAKQLPWHSVSRLWYNVIGLLAGYGYLPDRAFKISIFVVALGTFVFFSAHCNGNLKNVDEKDPGRSNHRHGKKHKFNPFIYSFETFVPLLELDMAKEWRPSGKALRFYYYLHRIGGWTLTTLWVGGFTGLIKT
jgi:hypothetical protein